MTLVLFGATALISLIELFFSTLLLLELLLLLSIAQVQLPAFVIIVLSNNFLRLMFFASLRICLWEAWSRRSAYFLDMRVSDARRALRCTAYATFPFWSSCTFVSLSPWSVNCFCNNATLSFVNFVVVIFFDYVLFFFFFCCRFVFLLLFIVNDVVVNYYNSHLLLPTLSFSFEVTNEVHSPSYDIYGKLLSICFSWPTLSIQSNVHYAVETFYDFVNVCVVGAAIRQIPWLFSYAFASSNSYG